MGPVSHAGAVKKSATAVNRKVIDGRRVLGLRWEQQYLRA